MCYVTILEKDVNLVLINNEILRINAKISMWHGRHKGIISAGLPVYTKLLTTWDICELVRTELNHLTKIPGLRIAFAGTKITIATQDTDYVILKVRRKKYYLKSKSMQYVEQLYPVAIEIAYLKDGIESTQDIVQQCTLGTCQK